MKHFRNNNSGIAMGIAFLGWLLAAANVHAQPVRRPRPETTHQQRLAQVAAQSATIPPADCPDRAGSARVAAEARDLHRSRNLIAAETAWDTAIALCGLPDRYEGRARTREARQGELDGEQRLRMLDGAISDYTTAVQRAHLAPGFDSSAIEAALPSLRNVREALDRRLHPLSVTSVRPPAPATPAACSANLQTDPANCGTCGNRCASGQSCSAGRCHATVGGEPRPVTPPPTAPNRTLARALWIGGSVATVTGLTLAIRGHLAAGDVDTLCEAQGRTTGCNRVASGADPRTLAALTVPGWITTGVGLAAIVTGVVLELRAGSANAERRPAGPTARPTATLSPDGTATVGLVGTF